MVHSGRHGRQQDSTCLAVFSMCPLSQGRRQCVSRARQPPEGKRGGWGLPQNRPVFPSGGCLARETRVFRPLDRGHLEKTARHLLSCCLPCPRLCTNPFPLRNTPFFPQRNEHTFFPQPETRTPLFPSESPSFSLRTGDIRQETPDIRH